MWSVGCGMLGVGCGMLNVECGTRIFLPQMPQIDTDAMRAESPMTSIAQGKRSDALGKPKRHALQGQKYI